jgi:carboxyl-terminal processing protease
MNNQFKKTLFTIVLSLGVGIIIGFYLMPAKVASDKVAPSFSSAENISQVQNADEKDLSLFWEVWEKVEEVHADPEIFEEKKMVYGAIRGMIESIGDPYTVFMDPEESTEFLRDLDGQLSGIGAEIDKRDDDLIVVTPIKNSPAQKAGLMAGDVILAIDDEPVFGLNIFEAVRRIRGEKGTSVKLTIRRESEPQALDLEIVRNLIKIDSVEIEMIDGIAHLSIHQFTEETIYEFRTAIERLKSEKAKALVLDLRFNGGGYLDSAVDILSELIAGEKVAVKIESRIKENNEIAYVSGQASLPDLPLVVLINEGSASASEIVAGAIQDYKRGAVFGVQSFGKGSVQEVINGFKDGSTLRATVAKWLTPDGRSIDKEGIVPDKVVEWGDFEKTEGKIDPQLQAAIDYLRSTF